VAISKAQAINRASLGGRSRKEKLSPEERKKIASDAAKERWRRSREKQSQYDDAAVGSSEDLPIETLVMRFMNRMMDDPEPFLSETDARIAECTTKIEEMEKNLDHWKRLRAVIQSFKEQKEGS
jgi:hypothetical protein